MGNKFAKENMSSGGFNLDGIYLATGARFEEDTHKISKDSSEEVTDVVCILELQDEAGNDMEHKLKLGSAEKFQVTDDGADYDGPGISDRSKYGVFLNSLEDAGCDMGRFYNEKTEKGQFGAGMAGLKFEARPEEIPGKPSFNNGKSFFVTKVVRLIEDESGNKAKVVKGKGATAGKPAGKAKEPEVEEPSADDLDTMAQEVMMELLTAASQEEPARKVKRTKLPMDVFKFIMANKGEHPDWMKAKTEISKKVGSKEWLDNTGLGHPWESNKNEVWVD